MFEEDVGSWRSGASPGLGLRRLGMAPPFHIVQDGGQLTSSAWSSVPYQYNEKIAFNNCYDYFTKP